MRFLILLSLGFLAACGFQPVHGTHGYKGAAISQLSLVSIPRIPEREGQILRNNLIDRFHVRGTPKSPKYDLVINQLQTQVTRLGIAADASTTRAQYEASATVSLKDKSSDEIVLTRNYRTLAGFNILGSEFQSVIAEENARDRALNQMSEQIETQLSLYFNR